MRRFTFASVVLALTFTAGCAHEYSASGNPGNPYPPVPPAMPDPRPQPPVSGEQLMWQPGHWDWNGSGYVWAPGVYVPEAGHGRLWMPGWWAQGPAGWSWQPAHWTS